MAESILEIKAKIAKYEAMGETELVNRYKAELANLERGSAPVAGDIVINVSPEEFEKAGSKFAMPGLHKSVFGMPYWKSAGSSLAFPFIITEGADKDKPGEIFCGVSAKAAFKIKEILSAINVPWKTNNGLVSFNPAEVAGKTAMTLWAQERDSRSEEEGGKGTIYTKVQSAYPIGSTLESIGISAKSLLI